MEFGQNLYVSRGEEVRSRSRLRMVRSTSTRPARPASLHSAKWAEGLATQSLRSPGEDPGMAEAHVTVGGPLDLAPCVVGNGPVQIVGKLTEEPPGLILLLRTMGPHPTVR